MKDSDQLFEDSTDPNSRNIFKVLKRGSVTRATTGTVDSIYYTAAIGYDGKVFSLKNLISIIRQSPGRIFASTGDSGAALLDAHGNVLGLVVSATLDPNNPDFGDATAVPIAAIEDQLDIEIADSIKYPGIQHAANSSGVHALVAEPERPGVPEPARKLLEQAEKEIFEIPEGKFCLEKIRQHAPEVLRLINNNTTVAMACAVAGVRHSSRRPCESSRTASSGYLPT